MEHRLGRVEHRLGVMDERMELTNQRLDIGSQRSEVMESTLLTIARRQRTMAKAFRAATEDAAPIEARVSNLETRVGKRIPMESNAWRVEGFLRYNFANTGKGLPTRLDIGARLGMSFWR